MFERSLVKTLVDRLMEPRRFMQVVIGPRQTGKTTAIRQAVEGSGLSARVSSADSPRALTGEWVRLEWEQARSLTKGGQPAVLVIDEVQKIDQWSEAVKALWDEDAWDGLPLQVILSGSSSLLVQKGLSESLAGRFEVLRSTHWSLDECAEAFGYSLEDYLRFGGYPGAASLRDDPDRWHAYLVDSIIESTLSKDVVQMEDVRKPVLMRRLFELGAQYSAQEVSYRKLLGQLDDKGNATTIAHYLDLLSGAGLISGLQKWSAKSLETRKSSPRLMVHDTSLMTSLWEGPGDLFEDPALHGHLVETAVGAYLIARSHKEGFRVMWWRDGPYEVDFVLQKGRGVTAVEVKSGKVSSLKGLERFCSMVPGARPIVVGDRNTPLEALLRGDIELF